MKERFEAMQDSSIFIMPRKIENNEQCIIFHGWVAKLKYSILFIVWNLVSFSSLVLQRWFHFQEAYVKALGRGFSAAPFKNFTIRFRAATEGHLHLSGNSNSKVCHMTSSDKNWITEYAITTHNTIMWSVICMLCYHDLGDEIQWDPKNKEIVSSKIWVR